MKRFLMWMTMTCCTVFLAVAQENLSLSLKDAESYAIEHNRTLQNASLSVRQAEAKRWQSIASMLPQVDASLSYMNMCGYKINMGMMEMAMPPYGSLSLTASIAVNGQMIMGALMSDLSIEMSDLSVKKTEQVIGANVMTVYVSILATEQSAGLLKQSQTNLQDMYNMQAKAVEVGSVEQVDADKLLVQLASMKNRINNMDRQLQVLYNSLRLLLGVGVDTELVLTQTLDEVINAESIMSLLGQELSVSDNYDYQLAEKQVELAKQQKTMAWMAYTPTLSAYYQYSGRTYFGEDEGFNMTPPNTVGVTLSVPIWSSGVRAAGISEKKRAYEASQNSLDDTRDQLLSNDRQYRYDLTTSFEDYQLQKDNIEVSQRVYDNIANKFKYGYSSSLDLTNASNDLITAQSSYVSSLTQMFSAYVNLKNLLNK
ncbi:MAG: TolC family protein [Paludibacteraceae bacterium]|nr:TolC family protein [Paludibacteraceae bacterium]